MTKEYKFGHHNFYHEKKELQEKLIEYEKLEHQMFEDALVEQGIDIVSITKIKYYAREFKNDVVKFKLVDVYDDVYISIFRHEDLNLIKSYDFKEMSVHKIPKEDLKRYLTQNSLTDYGKDPSPNINLRYRFFLPYMKVVKFN